MSQFWPHPPYAEDQPLSKCILSTHVLMRGLAAGSLFGTAIGAARHIRVPAAQKSLVPWTTAIVRGAGTGGAFGVGLLGLAMVGRMWGRGKIEWQDRSWRLLENRGQVEVDSWSLAGAVAGVALVLKDSTIRKAGWRTVNGGLGLGMLVGTGGYMVYRHGIKGGKWE